MNATPVCLKPACPTCGEMMTLHNAERVCVSCDDLAMTDVPTDDDVAEYLQLILDPESGADDRETAIEELHDRIRVLGRASVCSYRDVGMLTDDAGLVLRVGSSEYQITVVSR